MIPSSLPRKYTKAEIEAEIQKLNEERSKKKARASFQKAKQKRKK